MTLDLERQPHQFDLGLRLGELVDGDRSFLRFRSHGATHAVAALSSRSAAARASAVISAPASMRAISSRR